MTLNPFTDQQAIIARLETLAQPVYETIDDIQEMPRDASGALLPFVEVDFGTLTATVRNRSFAGDGAQPHETYMFVTAYARNKEMVRQIVGHILEPGFLIGWTPSVNVSTMVANGGSQFEMRSETRPTIYALRTTFRFSVNLATQSS